MQRGFSFIELTVRPLATQTPCSLKRHLAAQVTRICFLARCGAYFGASSNIHLDVSRMFLFGSFSNTSQASLLVIEIFLAMQVKWLLYLHACFLHFKSIILLYPNSNLIYLSIQVYIAWLYKIKKLLLFIIDKNAKIF